MNTTDTINLFLASITTVTAIVSIAISIYTLRQNNRMVEESTRPFIVIYFTYVDSLGYFIIKNEGNSLAVIDSLICDYEFEYSESGLE